MQVDDLLKEAIKANASDLHITVGVPPLIRVYGSLERMDKPKTKKDDAESACKQLLSEEKLRKFEEFGEVDTSYVIPEFGLFRVNCYRQRGVCGVAIRILSNRVFSLEELEMPQAIAEMAMRDRGLILVTGPTGSGKSTTMAAMANLINEEKELHIVTLEDPIEYFHKHKKSIITQREIGRDSLSFPSALRAALRQDPDVILVGEMRDLETISIAVTAAETGHLVMATLHTNDAAQSVERIIDSFPYNQQQQIRVQLSSALVGIVSQRLVRRKNGKGRIAAVEILKCNHAIRNLIREGKIHQLISFLETGSRYGMQTMDKHLQILYEQGIICEKEAMAVAADIAAMQNYIKTRAINH